MHTVYKAATEKIKRGSKIFFGSHFWHSPKSLEAGSLEANLPAAGSKISGGGVQSS